MPAGLRLDGKNICRSSACFSARHYILMLRHRKLPAGETESMSPSKSALILITFLAISACSGNKPGPNQVFLMPASGICELHKERALLKYEDFPVWDFREDYVNRPRAALAQVNSALGAAIREYEASLEAGGSEKEEAAR